MKHDKCPLESMEEQCPFRFVRGQPCVFRSNKLFWAICLVFLAQSAYWIYANGWSGVIGGFLLFAGAIVLWAVFEGFKYKE